MKHNLTVKNPDGSEITLHPEFGLYAVTDLMGRGMHNPAIKLCTEDGEPYAYLTTSFGEFIGMKNCAYIDTNNCPFAAELLNEDFAMNTGFTKESGFCKYPLWEFSEEYLKDIGGEKYELYSKEYDSYMGIGEDESESFEQTM